MKTIFKMFLQISLWMVLTCSVLGNNERAYAVSESDVSKNIYTSSLKAITQNEFSGGDNDAQRSQILLQIVLPSSEESQLKSVDRFQRRSSRVDTGKHASIRTRRRFPSSTNKDDEDRAEHREAGTVISDDNDKKIAADLSPETQPSMPQKTSSRMYRDDFEKLNSDFETTGEDSRIDHEDLGRQDSKFNIFNSHFSVERDEPRSRFINERGEQSKNKETNVLTDNKNEEVEGERYTTREYRRSQGTQRRRANTELVYSRPNHRHSTSSISQGNIKSTKEQPGKQLEEKIDDSFSDFQDDFSVFGFPSMEHTKETRKNNEHTIEDYYFAPSKPNLIEETQVKRETRGSLDIKDFETVEHYPSKPEPEENGKIDIVSSSRHPYNRRRPSQFDNSDHDKHRRHSSSRGRDQMPTKIESPAVVIQNSAAKVTNSEPKKRDTKGSLYHLHRMAGPPYDDGIAVDTPEKNIPRDEKSDTGIESFDQFFEKDEPFNEIQPFEESYRSQGGAFNFDQGFGRKQPSSSDSDSYFDMDFNFKPESVVGRVNEDIHGLYRNHRFESNEHLFESSHDFPDKNHFEPSSKDPFSFNSEPSFGHDEGAAHDFGENFKSSDYQVSGFANNVEYTDMDNLELFEPESNPHSSGPQFSPHFRHSSPEYSHTGPVVRHLDGPSTRWRGNGLPNHGARAPIHGPRTPSHGHRTPSHGHRTPSHGHGGGGHPRFPTEPQHETHPIGVPIEPVNMYRQPVRTRHQERDDDSSSWSLTNILFETIPETISDLFG